MKLPVSYNSKIADQLKNQVVLIKFGGNAMVDETIKKSVVNDIVDLKKLGLIPVVVHGGGPVIRQMLEVAKIESKFVEGHRVTDAKAMGYVEMALSGKVNGELVTLINSVGGKAVGLSGKDGMSVTAKKRFHQPEGETRNIDLGYVGDVESINTDLIQTLIDGEYIPVVSPVSMDANGDTYNINADMFAGHLAGALKSARYAVLTDVNGVMSDPKDPSSLVKSMPIEKAEAEIGGIIQAGMIPKIESCIIALKKGVQSAHIINGMKLHTLLKELLTDGRSGTLITH